MRARPRLAESIGQLIHLGKVWMVGGMACIHGISLSLHQANCSESRCMHMQRDAFVLPYVPTRAFAWKGYLINNTIAIGSSLLISSTSYLR